MKSHSVRRKGLYRKPREPGLRYRKARAVSCAWIEVPLESPLRDSAGPGSRTVPAPSCCCARSLPCQPDSRFLSHTFLEAPPPGQPAVSQSWKGPGLRSPSLWGAHAPWTSFPVPKQTADYAPCSSCSFSCPRKQITGKELWDRPACAGHVMRFLVYIGAGAGGGGTGNPTLPFIAVRSNHRARSRP